MNQGDFFLKPRLLGDRFADHAIPLEVLKDLTILEEMIVEIAKHLYFNNNPDRKRIPRRFTDEFSIKMIGIGDGSAIPEFRLCQNATIPALFPSDNLKYFQKARESFLESINAAECGESITKHLPSHLLGYFDRIGRSLRDDESIEFNPQNTNRPARLNKETRKKLVASSQMQELTQKVVKRGLIPEADQDKKSFTIHLGKGEKVEAPLFAQYHEIVMEAFNGYKSNTQVVIHGIGRFNRYDKLQCFDSVQHINILDELDVTIRLEELSELKHGWCDGKGFAFDKSQLDWLAKSFDFHYDPALPLPRLFPTPDGEIRAEWSHGDWEVSLEINLHIHNAEYQALRITTQIVDEAIFNLNKKDDWQRLNQKMKAILENV